MWWLRRVASVKNKDEIDTSREFRGIAREAGYTSIAPILTASLISDGGRMIKAHIAMHDERTNGRVGFAVWPSNVNSTLADGDTTNPLQAPKSEAKDWRNYAYVQLELRMAEAVAIYKSTLAEGRRPVAEGGRGLSRNEAKAEAAEIFRRYLAEGSPEEARRREMQREVLVEGLVPTGGRKPVYEKGLDGVSRPAGERPEMRTVFHPKEGLTSKAALERLTRGEVPHEGRPPIA